MKILSISTSSRVASVAVSEDGECINEQNINNLKTHSENLVPLIQSVLEQCKLTLNDIFLIAVDIGPRFIYRN